MTLQRKKILVLGGTGFIGQHLVARLLAEDAEVTVVTRPGRELPAAWQGVQVFVCAELEKTALAEVFEGAGFDVVFNLAAYGVRPGDRDMAQMRLVNHELPPLLVELAGPEATVVNAGSSAEYARLAEISGGLREDMPLETAKLYGTSKATGGLMAHAVAAVQGSRFAHLRLFNVYGPGEAAHRLLPSLIGRLSRGETVALSAGTQVRDFVYVADAVDALVRTATVLQAQTAARQVIWNVAGGQGTTVRQMAEAVAQAMGADLALLAFGALPFRPDDLPWVVGSVERLGEGLGWVPQTDIHTGMAEMIKAVGA